MAALSRWCENKNKHQKISEFHTKLNGPECRRSHETSSYSGTLSIEMVIFRADDIYSV